MGLLTIVGLLASFQVLLGLEVVDKYEPMVAFSCGHPAMHRGVDGWTADNDDKYSCVNDLDKILDYCKMVYPDHNITNIVETSYLVTIPHWPEAQLQNRVRPYRCLVGGFQSDALLVPQHCVFDHKHDEKLCEGFSHWNVVADDACRSKKMQIESFGMLLNCGIGKFGGVEYVCCPYQMPTTKDDYSDETDSEEDDDSVTPQEGGADSMEDMSTEANLNEEVVDLYEAYLRGKPFPRKYYNEHKKFIAAKDRMKKNQQQKTAKLLQQWQAARDHVDEVRKVDPNRADELAKEIAERFQKLYSSYEAEDSAEKVQLNALHQQHVQASLNEHKRVTMDKYMKSLDEGDNEDILHDLRNYIKAEEKDRMHTVNHFEHVKFSNAKEALRIHPFIVNHLKLSEQRIDQALEMLNRYPEVEVKIRPEIEEFMRRFDAIANSIKNVVLPKPEVMEETTTNSEESNNYNSDDSEDFDIDRPLDAEGDDITEDEHDYERNNMANNRMDNGLNVQQGLRQAAASSGFAGTLGIALGGVSVFVIVVVSVFMVKRKNRSQHPNPGYVEVDPSASPEERHVANMQMNGYENPTYRYFEVQSNPSA